MAPGVRLPKISSCYANEDSMLRAVFANQRHTTCILLYSFGLCRDCAELGWLLALSAGCLTSQLNVSPKFELTNITAQFQNRKWAWFLHERQDDENRLSPIFWQVAFVLLVTLASGSTIFGRSFKASRFHLATAKLQARLSAPIQQISNSWTIRGQANLGKNLQAAWYGVFGGYQP